MVVDDDLVHHINIALQQLKRNMESGVHNIDTQLTKPQMFVLYAISRFEPCKLTNLAEMMDVKPSAITVMIDRLEKLEYVNRMMDPTDRRAYLVELTDGGKATLEKAVIERNRILKKYLSRLTHNEIILFAELLGKIAETDRFEDGSVIGD